MYGGSIYDNPFIEIQIEKFVYTLSWWRRLLARFFKKYKITQKEFEDWYLKDFELTNNT